MSILANRPKLPNVTVCKRCCPLANTIELMFTSQLLQLNRGMQLLFYITVGQRTIENLLFVKAL
jgi:hypothetical protein